MTSAFAIFRLSSFIRLSIRQFALVCQRILLGVCLTFAGIPAMAMEIVHNHSAAPKEQLALEILKLVLAHDPKGREYRFRALSENVDEGRLVQMINDGVVNVMWAGTQADYEQAMRPIRIPMFKGMLGHRIFIIREGDQPKFDVVETLDDLKKIAVGQGRFWGDTAILRHSGFNVITAVKYEGLFHMLDGGRFDYFPRAIHEPWTELQGHSELDLVVEKKILLIYPFAMYFFVSKDNTELAGTIRAGFMAAIEDGSYDKLFFGHPVIKTALKKSRLEKRKIFRIPNPQFAEDALPESSLWLDIENL
jgi:hypothetical protein